MKLLLALRTWNLVFYFHVLDREEVKPNYACGDLSSGVVGGNPSLGSCEVVVALDDADELERLSDVLYNSN